MKESIVLFFCLVVASQLALSSTGKNNNPNKKTDKVLELKQGPTWLVIPSAKYAHPNEKIVYQEKVPWWKFGRRAIVETITYHENGNEKSKAIWKLRKRGGFLWRGGKWQFSQ